MYWVDLKLRKQSTLTVAGQGLSVVTAPRPKQLKGVSKVFHALKSVLTGMRVTLSYFRRPSTVVTRQYPENREDLKMHKRYRAKLEFLYDEDFHRCTACRICERECPNGSIIIDATKGAITKKLEVDRYIWRLDTCTFCNICVQVCPFEAIDFTGEFESSVYDRRLLVYNLNNYAGPHASIAAKVEDESDRATLKRPCSAFTGPLPLTGTAMAGIPALPGAAQVVEASASQASSSEAGSSEATLAPEAKSAEESSIDKTDGGGTPQ